ncbi:MAG: tetratricopeptide repeat protein [Deltaproteobacteria bacterium]|nr:tetratricopeptide repeat protein [Deltaproteobacteria bacterium]
MKEEKICSDGECVPLDDSDKVLAILKESCSDKRGIFNQLYKLVVVCANKGDDVSAYAYAEKMLLYAEDAREKAYCLLSMGQSKERVRDYGEALKIYLSAMDLPPERNDNWYFLYNNTGYCLNLFGRHVEAMQFCRAAIEINPDRHNAFKNLGVALQGQGEYSKAAVAYIEAIRICPRDGRALNLLEELVSCKGEHILDIGHIMAELWRCRDLVEQTMIH